MENHWNRVPWWKENNPWANWASSGIIIVLDTFSCDSKRSPWFNVIRHYSIHLQRLKSYWNGIHKSRVPCQGVNSEEVSHLLCWPRVNNHRKRIKRGVRPITIEPGLTLFLQSIFVVRSPSANDEDLSTPTHSDHGFGGKAVSVDRDLTRGEGCCIDWLKQWLSYDVILPTHQQSDAIKMLVAEFSGKLNQLSRKWEKNKNNISS